MRYSHRFSTAYAAPLLFLLCGLLFLPSPALAEKTQPLAVKAGDGVHMEVLDNGMTLILKESHAAPVVSVQAWIRFGSMHEEDKLGHGMAHYIEHMIFKGTEKRGVGQFDREIRGAGGELNAYTSHDHTVLHMTVAARDVDIALDGVADVLQNSVFDPEETLKEKDVIVRELEGYKDDPDRIFYNMFNQTIWPDYPRGTSVGGYLDMFVTVTRDELADMFHKHYVPNNMALVLVGDFSIQEKLPLLRQLFQDWPRGPELAPRVPHQLWPTGVTEVEDWAETAQTTRIQIGWPTVSMLSEDMYPLDVFAAVLGQGRTSRLYQRLVVDEGIARYVHCGNWTPQDHWGYFYVSAGLFKPEDKERFLAIVDEEIAALKAEGITAEEMGRVVRRLEADKVFETATASQVASSLGNGWLVGDLFFDDLYIQKLQQVAPEDITRAVAQYLGPQPRVIATLYPGTPPDSVAQESQDAESASDELAVTTLDNGVRLVVKRNPDVAEAEVRIAFMGGTRLEPQGKEGINRFMAALLDKGAGQRDAEAMFEAIENVGGSIGANGGRNSLYLSSRVLSRDLPLALELLADMSRKPSFSPEWIELVRQHTLQGLKQQREDTGQVNNLNIMNLAFAGHPYSRNVLGTEESVSGITREDLLAFQKAILQPENCVISVVGDVDRTEVEKLVAQSFGDWQGTFQAPAEIAMPEPTEPTRVVEEMESVNLSELALTYPSVAIGNEDYYAFQVLEKILGGMGSRLFVDMRDHKALAYSVGCYNFSGLDGGRFFFFISPSPHESGRLSTYSAVLDESLASFKEQVQRLKDEPVSQEELDFAKENLMGVHAIGQQSNGAQALDIALDVLYGFAPDRSFDFDRHIEKVTAQDIQRLAKTYFDNGKTSVAIVRPKGQP